MKRAVHASPNTVASIVALAFFSCVISCEIKTSSKSGAKETPEYVLNAWVQALNCRNQQKVKSCFDPEAQAFHEYTTGEAIEFWNRQIEELRQNGFSGQWKLSSQETDVTGTDPHTTIRAYPVVRGSASKEYILLIQKADRWMIWRLF